MSYRPVLNRSFFNERNITYQIKYEEMYVNLDDPEIDQAHIHGDAYEIYLNVSGDVSFFMGSKLYPVKRGDIVFTKAGDVHFCVYHSACKHTHYCLWFDYPKTSALAALLPAFEENLPRFFSLPSEDKEHILQLFEQFQTAETEKDSLSSSVCFLQILEFLHRRISGACIKNHKELPNDLQAVLNDIDKNFTHIQSIGELLKNHFISSATLNRRFQKYLHVSPQKFLTAKKLAYAKRLLSENASVTDAYLKSGFSDYSRFISLFKKKFAITPLQFKRSIGL